MCLTCLTSIARCLMKFLITRSYSVEKMRYCACTNLWQTKVLIGWMFSPARAKRSSTEWSEVWHCRVLQPFKTVLKQKDAK